MAFFEKQGNISRVNKEINKDLEDINKKYTEIGRIVKLRCLDQVDNEDVHRLAKEIDGLLAELLRLKEELNVINGIKICPQCNAQIDINVAFCPNCGTKQPAAQTSAPAAPAAPAAAPAPTPAPAPAPVPAPVSVPAPAVVPAPVAVPDVPLAAETVTETAAEVVEAVVEEPAAAVTEAAETASAVEAAPEQVTETVAPEVEIPAAPSVENIPAPNIAPPVMPAPATIPEPAPAPAAPASIPSVPAAGQSSIFCTQCGSKEPAGTRFCSQCGSPM